MFKHELQRFLPPLLVLVTFAHCQAQLPQVANKRLGVDRVDLIGGERLYGFILESNPQRLTIAVERKWLAATYPALHEQNAARELAEAEDARVELIGRLDQWMQRRVTEPRFHRFLATERERIEAEQAIAPDTLFMRLVFENDQVRSSQLAPASQRHIAGIAYQHGLESVIVTPTTILARRLTEAQIDISQETVDLLDQLPALQRQSDRQWAARMALIEFERLEPLEYQGTGSSFFKTGETVDIGQLIPQLLQNNSLDPITQLGVELGLPEFKKLAQVNSSTQGQAGHEWWRPVVDRAAKEGMRGVLIKRLDQSWLNERVKVSCHFLACDEQDQWFEVVQFDAQVEVGQVTEEQRQQLRDDPQVAQVLNLLQGFGLADATRTQRALDQGLATQAALREATNQFRQFSDRFTRQLNGPPLPVE